MFIFYTCENLISIPEFDLPPLFSNGITLMDIERMNWAEAQIQSCSSFDKNLDKNLYSNKSKYLGVSGFEKTGAGQIQHKTVTTLISCIVSDPLTTTYFDLFENRL